MKFTSGQEFLADESAILVIAGPSGAGKTTVCRRLNPKDWFHYMVDYRIWTYQLADELKNMYLGRAMRDPVLALMLRNDSLSVTPKIAFNNLFASSIFMGMPGDPERGGSRLADFNRRMERYRPAEIEATLEALTFQESRQRLLVYPRFVMDSSGSLCHMVDPSDPDDPVARFLDEHCVFVNITCTRQHSKALLAAAVSDPKPIYYPGKFLDLELPGLLEHFDAGAVEELDPRAVGRYLYPRLISERQRQYEALARRFGYSVPMNVIGAATTGDSVLQCIADAIDEQNRSGRLVRSAG